MNDMTNLGPKVIIWFDKGPLAGLQITETVIWAIIVSIFLIVLGVVSTRNLKRYPRGAQAIAEFIVDTVYSYVKNTMGRHNMAFAPLIGTLFLFLVISNAMGLFAFRPVTADMNTTFALAIMVFILIQYNAIKSGGIKRYLKGFAEPFPFMIPSNVVGELTFPVSLSFRLFGNMMAGVIVSTLVLNGLGQLSTGLLHLPIPLLQIGIPLPLNLFFDMFVAVIQALVFSMLAMVFISKAIVVKNPGQ